MTASGHNFEATPVVVALPGYLDDSLNPVGLTLIANGVLQTEVRDPTTVWTPGTNDANHYVEITAGATSVEVTNLDATDTAYVVTTTATTPNKATLNADLALLKTVPTAGGISGRVVPPGKTVSLGLVAPGGSPITAVALVASANTPDCEIVWTEVA